MEIKQRMMKFSSEEELEEWYASEKKKLEDDFLKKLDSKNKDFKDNKQEFEKNLKELINKYNEEYEQFLGEK